MRKRTRTWLITAAALVVLGLFLFAAVMTAYHWDFTKCSTVKYGTSTYEINENFRDIVLDTDTADILLVPAKGQSCIVVCYEAENAASSVSVQDGALVIQKAEEQKWYEHIGIEIERPRITVSLPQREYASLVLKGSTGAVEIPKDFRFARMEISISTGDIDSCASVSDAIHIRTNMGSICLEGIFAKEIDLSASTGDVTISDASCEGEVRIHTSTQGMKLTDVSCGDLHATGTTGVILLENVLAEGKISIENSTGDVTIDDSDAAELFVKTATGNVTGRLLTEKVFLIETSTGRIDVPKTATGGKCEITTDTGDVFLRPIAK